MAQSMGAQTSATSDLTTDEWLNNLKRKACSCPRRYRRGISRQPEQVANEQARAGSRR